MGLNHSKVSPPKNPRHDANIGLTPQDIELTIKETANMPVFYSLADNFAALETELANFQKEMAENDNHTIKLFKKNIEADKNGTPVSMTATFKLK